MFTKVIKNPELQGTIIITTGSIIGSFFAYLLQFFLGRMLSVENYGSFSALISVSTIVGVFAGVFVIALVKIVSELVAKEDFERVTALFWKVTLWGLLYGLVAFFLVYILKNYISSTLKISDVTAIVFFGWFLGMNLFPPISRSYLQALLRYKALAFFLVYSGFLRFVFPVVFVYFGYALSGVFFGMGIGLALSFVFSLLLLRKNFRKHEIIDLSEQYEKFLMLGLPITILFLGLMILSNMDMILVKRFFDPDLAGYYAGTVTLGKILLFGAGSVNLIMFPQISAVYTKGENYIEKFKKLLFMQIGVVIAGVVPYIAFPKFLTTAFFGKSFLGSVEYLPLFSIFVGLYVLVNFMVLFFLAIDKKNVFWFLVPGVTLQTLLIYFLHADLYQVIYINIGVSLATCLALFIYYRKTVSQALF